MNKQHELDLRALRQAADERDQEQLQFLLKRLMSGLEYFGAVALVTHQLVEFLPIFESYYEDEGWVAQLLSGVSSYGMAPDDQVAQMALGQPFHEPGAGNYIKGIYDLTQMMQKKHTPESRIGYAVSAIVSAIMAELLESYFADRPEDWSYFRNAQMSQQDMDDRARQISMDFWLDPDTAALDSALWYTVAERVEEALQRQGN